MRDCILTVGFRESYFSKQSDRFRDMNVLVYKRYCANSRTVAEEFDYKNLVSVLIKQIEAYD